ncbi:cysteine--tRNA ligase [Alphaproteobacteria bacterium endosymbiont of Tiliacea citrago]|uniref:cysteine--tRNA ligase n=1 Tax=Alphaproteobacteria bacterium endosymbiont of Tiliacea citrago TaxID=3077944 RepID=UPI00313DD94B
MKLKIYNSKTNKKEVFEPIDASSIKMYVCGPTVYNEIHIGNARSAISFDVLYRVLKAIYPEVIYARNITDIDDKIINRAKEEGKTSEEVAQYWEASYLENCKKLNLLDPTYKPRATDTVKEIIEFVGQLIENGYAYEKQGTVFFDVSELKEYGSLSKNDSLIEGKRIAVNESKDDPYDFVLWKPSKETYEPYWKSPWGEGRPGWHIECSAMSKKFLGEKFDIHAGGSDLLFPHHENEQAQNYGCCGVVSGPTYWMHNAMLVLGKEKMSKSIGNIILLSEAFKKYDPVFLKFYMLNTHYRHILSWDDENMKAFAIKFSNWIMHLGYYFKEATEIFSENDLNELLNDLNTPGFFANFETRLAEAIKTKNKEEYKMLAGLLKLLGLEVKINEPTEEIKELANRRLEAKKLKDYKEADKIRACIESNGFHVLDNALGYQLKPNFKCIFED